MNGTAQLFNLDAERGVIGGILLENTAAGEALSILQADGSDFYHTGNRLIFQAGLGVINRGGVADLITVGDELQSRGNLEKAGGPAYVAEVMDGAISAANVRHYAEIVKGYAIRRTIIDEAQKVINAALSTTVDTTETLEQAQRSILSLSMQKEKSTTRNSYDLVKQTMANIESRHEKGDLITGIETGHRDFDNLILGLNSGESLIIAGRPAMGKTAFAGSIAQNVALQGNPVAIFSLEMPGESLMIRYLSGQTGIDSRHLRRGFISDHQWPKLISAAQTISKTLLFIDDKPDITPMELRAKARRIKAEHGLSLLIVDYIQLMRVPGRHDTREQAVAEISRTLKAIARELNIPVIGLSQLNRQVDSRADKRPLLSDLRESGAIEQDADVIAFIYRDEVYDKRPDNPSRGIAEIEIAKHRNGPTGTIKLRFNPATQTFSDFETQRPMMRERADLA